MDPRSIGRRTSSSSSVGSNATSENLNEQRKPPRGQHFVELSILEHVDYNSKRSFCGKSRRRQVRIGDFQRRSGAYSVWNWPRYLNRHVLNGSHSIKCRPRDTSSCDHVSNHARAVDPEYKKYETEHTIPILCTVKFSLLLYGYLHCWQWTKYNDHIMLRHQTDIRPGV